MSVKNKIVPLGAEKFELRKLPTEVGSFIFMRMLGASMRMAASDKEEAPASTEESESTPVITGEMRVRALVFSVMSSGMSFEDFKFVQSSCMKVTSVVVDRAGQDFPMPVMTDNGAWTPEGKDLACNPGSVMQLVSAVLVFCFADFFDGASLGSLT